VVDYSGRLIAFVQQPACCQLIRFSYIYNLALQTDSNLFKSVDSESNVKPGCRMQMYKSESSCLVG